MISTFRGRLVLIAAAGLVVRVLQALFVAPATNGVFDAFFFQRVARLVAAGHGFIRPWEYNFHGGLQLPTAEHAPLYPLLLAGGVKLGLTSDEVQRAAIGSLTGVAAIVGIALIARRVAGPRAGLIAAGIGAVYPILIAADGALMSESLYGALIAFTLVAAYRALDAPSTGRFVALGLLIGLDALTRSEALLLVPLLALPLAGRAGRGRAGVQLLAVASVATVLVVAPWLVRNWIVFNSPVYTTNDSVLIAQANCDGSYHGHDIGYLDIFCTRPGPVTRSEAKQAAAWRRQGIDYARDHAGRLPLVMAVRFLRTWGFFQPRLTTVDTPEGRDSGVQEAGIFMYYPLLVLAALGVLLLRRLRQPLVVLLAPAVLVTLVSILGYGSLRLRHAAEIPLVVLAAVGTAHVLERVARRRSRAMEPAAL